MIAGRRILLGVSGGVAAYKSAYLARRLVEAGAEVRTIMTDAAREFLGERTLSAITGVPPVTTLFGVGDVSPHTELARWADAVVIAPATAATIARLAIGLSEDALSATVLATTAPVLVAPAMHTEMWGQPATQRNVAALIADGRIVVGPATGALAGGDSGPGRMVEPAEIIERLETALGGGSMEGVRVLVTAGGTREPIDPVRYIGNRSSGKMGAALADEAADRGAEVVLVTSGLDPRCRSVEVIRVETAAEMAEAVWSRAGDCDVAVLAAAVADFRPKKPASGKLRRAAGPPALDLEETPDILAGVAAMDSRPFLVGFAAETGPASGAAAKVSAKGVDLLVANDVTAEGSGFGTDTNQVTLLFPDGSAEEWELVTKQTVAARLWDRVAALRGTR